MKCLALVLVSAFGTMSCMDYKSTYPKRVSGIKNTDSEANATPDDVDTNDSETDPVVVDGKEDDKEVEPSVPVEPEVKPCMVPESKKGQIF